ncbi:MAG: phasin family protein [Fimbriimonadaceae bacterium]|nr:phasin family protein [Alphaproteobacteria bacterium]
MPKVSENTSETHGFAFKFPTISLPAMNGGLMDSCAGAAQTCLKNASEMNEEMMAFAGKRFNANAQRLHDLQGCRDWEKAVAVHNEFAQSMVEAYLSEMSKLSELAAKSYMTMFTSLQEAAKADDKKPADP